MPKASVHAVVRHIVKDANKIGLAIMPINVNTNSLIWRGAHGKTGKDRGLNKELILFVLLIAQESAGFKKNINLSRLTSTQLRNILKNNYNEVMGHYASVVYAKSFAGNRRSMRIAQM